MNIIADTHTHTIASTHAYSTLLENIAAAKQAGLLALGMTDHGCAMPDAPHIWHFDNLRQIPRILDGVCVLRGVEANISDYQGGLDLDNVRLSQMDWVVASMHAPVLKPGRMEDHTSAYLGVAQNPYVDVIGHSGTQAFLYDYETVLKVFKECGKLVELNEGSLRVRQASQRNCVEIAKLCKKWEVPVVINSDSHFSVHIGKFPHTLRMLEEIGFPERLVLNADADRFFGYIKEKRGIDFKNKQANNSL